MKPYLVLLSILLITPIFANSQRKVKKNKVYKVWVKKTDKSKVKGYLYSANDELLKVTKKISTPDLIVVNASDIDRIKVRRKGKVGKSALIGGGIGAGVGVTLGLISAWGDEAEWAAGVGLFFGTIGATSGVIVGIFPKTIRIKGSLETYKAELKWLQAYAIELETADANKK